MSKLTVSPQRSPCPVANALDLIGDKWTLLVLRDLFSGKSRYSELQSSPENIPTNILAERLKRLVTHGLVEKIPYQEKPVRYQYRLTSAGRSLRFVLKELSIWGLNNINGTEARIKMK